MIFSAITEAKGCKLLIYSYFVHESRSVQGINVQFSLHYSSQWGLILQPMVALIARYFEREDITEGYALLNTAYGLNS